MVTSATTSYVNLPPLTLSSSFYPDGSLQSLGTPAGTFSYNFDADGRLSSLVNSAGESYSWTYLDNGWLSTQSSGPALTTSYSYNAAGQLLDLANHKPGSGSTLLSEWSGMRYDGVGNLVSIQANVPAVTAYSGLTTYGFSGLDQLLSEQSQRAGGFSNSFNYDGAGNPLLFKGGSNSFNLDNQNTANSYDQNGNPVVYSGTALSFDANDHLTNVGNVLSAGYTADGKRAWKQTAVGTTYFLYSGSTPVIELDQNGNVQAVNTFGATGLLSRNTASGSVFYSFSPQGSVSERLNSSSAILSSLTFDAFGSGNSSVPVGNDPYSGFGGQWGYYTDVETGLQLLGQRYYDPTQGRFLTRDPLGYGGGINLYGYVGANPLSGIDPLGLDGIWTAVTQHCLRQRLLQFLAARQRVRAAQFGWEYSL